MPRVDCGRGPTPSAKSGACTSTCQVRCVPTEGGSSFASLLASVLLSDFAPSGARVAALPSLLPEAEEASDPSERELEVPSERELEVPSERELEVPSERELDGSDPGADARLGGCVPGWLGSDAASVEWISNPSSTAAAPARSSHEVDSMLRVPTMSRTRTTRSRRKRLSIRVMVPSARRWLSWRPDPRSLRSRSRTSLSCGQPGGASQRMSIAGCGSASAVAVASSPSSIQPIIRAAPAYREIRDRLRLRGRANGDVIHVHGRLRRLQGGG